jgi:excisionase family DNA binding protein
MSAATDAPAIEQELLTPREVASIFRVDVATVRNWAKSGRVPAIRCSQRCLRFRRDDLPDRRQVDCEAAR